MNDREAIKLLKTILRTVCLGNQKFIDAVKKAISALEKQEHDGWIPCSVKLPENKKKVLVSYDTEDGKKVDISMFDKYGCLLGLVSAWRPLPEPYTEDEDEEQKSSN